MQNYLRAFISAHRPKHLKPKRRERAAARHHRHPRLLDLLEDRVLLSGNIAVTGFAILNSSFQPLSTTSPGEHVLVEAKFSTTGLPSNSSYIVSIDVNGETRQTATLTLGSGVGGTDNWIESLGAFEVAPGTNQIIITADPAHTVAESSFTDNSKNFTFTGSGAAVGVVSADPAQVRNFYGVNSIPNFGTSSADGTGQTIALIDAANEPTILSDLDGFDKAMSATTTSTTTLFDQYGAASSFVTVYNQAGQNITANIANSGTNGVPAMDPTGHWEGEETLDVEWAHAMAPGAKLVIIEATDDGNVFPNLVAANAVAAALPGVTVVSNSWGMTDFPGEIADDSSVFVTPANHPGVTFITASNDNGALLYNGHGPTTPQNSYYPSTSPNVISVGGTQITLSDDGFGSEIAWSFPTPDNTFSFSNGTQAGSWTSHAGGFSGNYGTAAPGSNTTTWTVPITPGNTGFGTEVSATWVAAAGNATNATCNVYDGTASGTLLGTISVDQTKAPAGTPDGNRQFQELGVFFPTLNSGDGQLTVVLTSSGANGNVVADAVGAAQGWASSGGPALLESEPSYQEGVQSTGQRTTPDVSLISSQSSGVDTYITLAGNAGLIRDGSGTSLACPAFAGIMAIINQGRVAAGGATLNSTANAQQALQALYSIPSSDYHDITTGYNGFFATTGYDLVTGLGSPIANLLVPSMVAFGLDIHAVPTQLAYAQQPLSTTVAGQTLTHTGAGSPTIVVDVLDANGNIVANDSSSVTISLIGTNGATLSGTTTVQAVNGVATFTNLAADTVGTGYKLSAGDNGLTAALSSPFAVTADLGSSQIKVTQEPAVTLVGKALAPIIIVKSVDQFGNPITTDKSKIVLSSNTGSFTGTNSATLANGTATFSNIIFKTAGNYTLSATPATNSTLAVTTPVSFGVVISKATTTVPTPVVSVKGYTFGSTITLTDTLSANVPAAMLPFNSSASSPTLLIGGSNSGAITTFSTAGAAKFTLPALAAGVYSLQVVYPGDTNHIGNSSNSFTVTINKATTTTTLTTSSATLVFGQPITLTATVKSPNAPKIAPTGTVEFLDNGTIIHSAPLTTLATSSTAAFTFTPSSSGSHNFQLIYLASTDFAASTSAAKKMTVAKDKTTIHITAPLANTSIPHPQTFDLSVQVAVTAPGADALAGDLVTVKDNGKTIGTITLDGSGAGSLLGLSYTNSGTHSLSAIFIGDTDALTSTSSALKVIST